MAENTLLRVYTVIDKGENRDAFWLNIGSAHPHKDGKGMNVLLQAMPLDGKLVIREVSDEEAEKEDAPKRKGRSRS